MFYLGVLILTGCMIEVDTFCPFSSNTFIWLHYNVVLNMLEDPNIDMISLLFNTLLLLEKYTQITFIIDV